MHNELKNKVEKVIGDILEVNILEDQGCTSVVRQMITVQGIYVLKSSFEQKYREWLKDEALVLEKLNTNTQIPTPRFYGYIEEIDSSHIIMSFENGMTLTTALKKARNPDEKRTLIKSFGKFVCGLHETNPVGLGD
ncbi:hypothetical protein [Guptibacillus hwajinpoensis]|uniref:hypothetical protein n=1 Tax=Guptibacillus hwajinpoensis TaxID=208199 RepID=UPI00069EF565|nr:hypothetical protein [Alkalihalobacillus macyae]